MTNPTQSFTPTLRSDGTIVAHWNDPAGGRFHAERRGDTWRVFARYSAKGVPIEVTGRGSMLSPKVTDPAAIAALDLAAGVTR